MSLHSDSSGPVHDEIRTRSWSQIGYALRNRNFRTYLGGQGVSLAGMWMQQTAELWLIYEISGSGAALGLHSVLRFGPVLLFGAYAGVVADRMDRLKLLKLTQTLHLLAAGTLAVAAWLATPSLGLIYGIVLAQGLVNAFDNPLRRTFVRDLVSDSELSNAVSLNSTVGTVTRSLGPAAGGVIIASAGVEWCFALNAVSYVAVLIALQRIDRSRMRQTTIVSRQRGQMAAGLRYAWNHADIRVILTTVLAVSVFGWNWNVILPVYSQDAFAGDASMFGVMLSAIGLGAFFGALLTARAIAISDRRVYLACLALGISMMMAAVTSNLVVAFAALLLIGGASTAALVSTQARLQLEVTDEMSSRVVALFSVFFVGSNPIGGVVSGELIDAKGSRAAFAVLGVAVVLVGLWLVYRARRRANDSIL